MNITTDYAPIAMHDILAVSRNWKAKWLNIKPWVNLTED